mmetsp:Transcript_36447/g.81927  ORF Transcript_36447/g.81927 Transcript_36447/m.81927 type:complete len:283 (+) Transcript_36447:415-1263(+)
MKRCRVLFCSSLSMSRKDVYDDGSVDGSDVSRDRSFSGVAEMPRRRDASNGVWADGAGGGGTDDPDDGGARELSRRVMPTPAAGGAGAWSGDDEPDAAAPAAGGSGAPAASLFSSPSDPAVVDVSASRAEGFGGAPSTSIMSSSVAEALSSSSPAPSGASSGVAFPSSSSPPPSAVPGPASSSAALFDALTLSFWTVTRTFTLGPSGDIMASSLFFPPAVPPAPAPASASPSDMTVWPASDSCERRASSSSLARSSMPVPSPGAAVVVSSWSLCRPRSLFHI